MYSAIHAASSQHAAAATCQAPGAGETALSITGGGVVRSARLAMVPSSMRKRQRMPVCTKQVPAGAHRSLAALTMAQPS